MSIIGLIKKISPGDCKLLNKVLLKHFILYFLVLLASLSITVSLFILNGKMNTLNEYKIKSQIQLEYQKGLVENHFKSVQSDLLFLPKLNEIIRFKELSNQKDLHEIGHEFLEFSKVNTYMIKSVI